MPCYSENTQYENMADGSRLSTLRYADLHSTALFIPIAQLFSTETAFKRLAIHAFSKEKKGST